MGTHTIKLPDVGEGVAEAELVEWHVRVGEAVTEDTVLAAVMTDKATVDIPSPVDGTVAWLGGEVGETLAVGSPLVRLTVEGGEADEAVQEDGAGPAGGDGAADAAAAEWAETRSDESEKPEETPAATDGADTGARPSEPSASGAVPQGERAAVSPAARQGAAAPGPQAARRRAGERPLASPAVRRRAMEAGVDLRRVPGSAPAGRITQGDLDAFLEGGAEAPGGPARRADTSVEEVKIVGLRRRIAEKMALAKSRIAHITYVEEIDCQALEDLRSTLNRDRREDRPKLTLLPFLMQAMVVALREQPSLNAHFDDEAGVLRRHGGVHIGIAAQTEQGLVVPVVRHCETRDLWGSAAEAGRLAEAAKGGSAKREEMSGSTITITSLGALGGIATTPVINHPEVAIVGVNKMEVRPVWDGAQFVPRKRMNLSSSFDHRVVDGYDAAVFVQRIKGLLENPAILFMEMSGGETGRTEANR